MGNRIRAIAEIGCYIKLGTMVHAITELVTLGNAYNVAYWVATRLGYESCGCHEREMWLNSLTCKPCNDDN